MKIRFQLKCFIKFNKLETYHIFEAASLQRMKKLLYLFFSVMGFVVVDAQQDSIFIQSKLSDDLQTLTLNQNFKYKNKLEVPIERIKLLNWAAAYKNEGTSLYKRKIEDRKKELHFAKPEDLAKLLSLTVNDTLQISGLDDESIYINLPKPLNPGETFELKLDYSINLPKISITGYGTSDDKVALKYFFIVPDGFETEEQYIKSYNDVEETQSGGNFWAIKIDIPSGFAAESNLNRISENEFAGILTIDPELYISKNKSDRILVSYNGKITEIAFGYNLTPQQKSELEFYLPLQLKFIEERIGNIPSKLFISEKFRNKEDFFGNDDIKFWKFKFQMFSDAQKTDMDYFSIISKKIIQRKIHTEKIEDHWIKNGLAKYLEIQYLNSFYKDEKLLGKLPEEAVVFGIRPLKYFNASKLKLTERYGLAYQYILAQNLDQKIGEPFTVLSNFNDMAISNFETGSLFDYIAQKMNHQKFEEFLRNYFAKHENQIIDSKDFLDQLSLATSYSSDFLENYINHNKRLNFKARKFKQIPEGYLVDISKNSDYPIPIKITSENKSGEKLSFWYDTAKGRRNGQYLIPRSDINKIQLNDEYIFPESNYRDNYLYTKGLFANTKKIKLKFFTDIPDPEYNEIYLNPRLSINAYDKALIGLNFTNKSLFDQKFLFSVTPYFSTGTGKFTGAGSLAYSFRPDDSFYRSWQVGASGSYFHYDYDLAYRKLSLFSNINFAKVLRSSISRTLSFSYNYYEKDLNPLLSNDAEYSKYNLWNLGYSYVDNKLIHEISLGGNLQWMEDFQKLSAEAFYRWEFAENKKISFRFFGGYFFSNKAKNNLFDFGVSRVSNYAFNYNLLGQSATSGLLSQQYILAEGAFKSYLNSSVNQWITSFNVDSHVWKMFNVYADAGLYKNKGHDPKFIWDSGIKLKVIPDFLEIYFPIQSSLGFEPSFSDYGKRIRYTLIFNFSALTNHFRRGWY